MQKEYDKSIRLKAEVLTLRETNKSVPFFLSRFSSRQVQLYLHRVPSGLAQLHSLLFDLH